MMDDHTNKASLDLEFRDNGRPDEDVVGRSSEQRSSGLVYSSNLWDPRGVKYDCFCIESDDDFQVLFHFRQQFQRFEPLSCELAVAMAATLQPPSPQMCHANPEPLAGPSSSRTQQYPPHLPTLNLEVGSGVGPTDGDSGTYVHGSTGSNMAGNFKYVSISE
ncbi:hypothetical protein PIB30_035178 [Stylosanthes scabra]|uniref:Uncharacterized protein n=1 Tax=Stylosanthes scabra TaxID=79078 RepID=A0ABU6Z9U5_9FABA|nr:hypothetical protein [Stylosanthes scabra]